MSESRETTSVTACEVYPPMVKLAHQLIAHNKLASSINIHAKRSDELSVNTVKHTQSTPSAQAASKPLSHPTAQTSDSSQHHDVSTPALTSAAAKRKKYARQREDYAAAGRSSDMPCKADVIVTEIFDSELIGEGILPTMRHAVKHLLQVCVTSQHCTYGFSSIPH